MCASIRRSRSCVAAKSGPEAKLGGSSYRPSIFFPTYVIRFISQEQLQKLFISPAIAACFLMLNGALLYMAEHLRRTAEVNQGVESTDQRIAAKMSWWQSAKVGLVSGSCSIAGIFDNWIGDCGKPFDWTFS
jgi:hypothetical protein